MEGDLAYGRLVPVMGDATGPRVLLADDILRVVLWAGCEWNEALRFSSFVGISTGCDMILDDLFGNMDRGGARPDSCEICLVSFSGDGGIETGRFALALDGLLECSAGFCSGGMSSNSAGDCSRLIPKLPFASCSSRRPSCLPRSKGFGRGMFWSGVGGMRLIRGCIDTGRSACSSIDVVIPSVFSS